MNHSYYQKWQSQEHTNVQIKVNIPFLYFAAFNRQCRCFIVNHRVRFFSDISRCQHRLFFLFLRHFLDFTDVGPEWFLAKSRCACCSNAEGDEETKRRTTKKIQSQKKKTKNKERKPVHSIKEMIEKIKVIKKENEKRKAVIRTQRWRLRIKL